MTCQTCKHQKRGYMSQHGFHACAIAKRWESFAPSFTCAGYTAESAQARAARRAAGVSE